MAEIVIDIKDDSGLLKAATRAARIITLRELAAELNARADVLEAAGALEPEELRAHAAYNEAHRARFLPEGKS
jgi:hypothetical protein